MKIDHTKLQDDSEVECTQRFLPFFNTINASHFENPKKNPIQNEVDVFCYDTISGNRLDIQVKKADPISVGNLGKSRRIPIDKRPSITRDQNQAKDRILTNIKNAEEKYFKQKKDISNIVLLLDEMFDPPSVIVQQIKDLILPSTFKEVWLVTRNNVYQIY